MNGPHTAAFAPSRRQSRAIPRAESHFTTPVTAASERAVRMLLGRQESDGHWVGELQGDTILESEYVLLMAFLGRESDEKVTKAARYILSQQSEEGGWSNYPDGPADINVSTKAYFALKLAGLRSKP